MTTPRTAADCATMAELRAEIDRVDAALVALLAERAGYIDRAAELKAALGWPARIEARVEEVVANVRARAEARGLPPVGMPDIEDVVDDHENHLDQTNAFIRKTIDHIVSLIPQMAQRI